MLIPPFALAVEDETNRGPRHRQMTRAPTLNIARMATCFCCECLSTLGTQVCRPLEQFRKDFIGSASRGADQGSNCGTPDGTGWAARDRACGSPNQGADSTEGGGLPQDLHAV